MRRPRGQVPPVLMAQAPRREGPTAPHPRPTSRTTPVTTLRQIEANRRNAAHSCGPKTEEGKARSRANALKHGLAGAGVVLPDEIGRKVQERREQWRPSLRPGDAAE